MKLQNYKNNFQKVNADILKLRLNFNIGGQSIYKGVYYKERKQLSGPTSG